MWFAVSVPICCRYLAGTGTAGTGDSCLAFVRDEHDHLTVLVVVFLHRGVALSTSAHVLQESRHVDAAAIASKSLWPARIV